MMPLFEQPAGLVPPARCFVNKKASGISSGAARRFRRTQPVVRKFPSTCSAWGLCGTFRAQPTFGAGGRTSGRKEPPQSRTGA